MFGSVKKSPERLPVIERVTQWTRERFKLPKEAVISVSEIACPLPGCPPLETVVAFWIAEQRYQFKLFKPVEEVVIDDRVFRCELLHQALPRRDRPAQDHDARPCDIRAGLGGCVRSCFHRRSGGARAGVLARRCMRRAPDRTVTPSFHLEERP